MGRNLTARSVEAHVLLWDTNKEYGVVWCVVQVSLCVCPTPDY